MFKYFSFCSLIFLSFFSFKAVASNESFLFLQNYIIADANAVAPDYRFDTIPVDMDDQGRILTYAFPSLGKFIFLVGDENYKRIPGSINYIGSYIENRSLSSIFKMNEWGHFIGTHENDQGFIVFDPWIVDSCSRYDQSACGRNSQKYKRFNGVPYAINASDNTVGCDIQVKKAFLFNPYQNVIYLPRLIGPLNAEEDSGAFSINALGQIVGYSNYCDLDAAGNSFSRKRAVMWSADGYEIKDLHPKRDFLGTSVAKSINNLGESVGIINGQLAFWDQKGHMRVFDYYPLENETLVINDLGHILTKNVIFDKNGKIRVTLEQINQEIQRSRSDFWQSADAFVCLNNKGRVACQFRAQKDNLLRPALLIPSKP